MTDLPLFSSVRQTFDRPRVDDRPAAVRRALEQILRRGSPRPGARIGVTVGSRGIGGLATMVRAAVDWLKERGAKPFIIPAMGSHGGATAEGQRRLIAHYGVTEEAMECPVRAEMGGEWSAAPAGAQLTNNSVHTGQTFMLMIFSYPRADCRLRPAGLPAAAECRAPAAIQR